MSGERAMRSNHVARSFRVALARYFNWADNLMLPEWHIDGGNADLLFISRAGYATEIEIKITLSDWNADRDKEKWHGERPHVARFFYAVTDDLADCVPAWIPDWAGVLALHVPTRGYPRVRTIREARRRRAEKIGQAERLCMYRSAYFRYWRDQMRRMAHGGSNA